MLGAHHTQTPIRDPKADTPLSRLRPWQRAPRGRPVPLASAPAERNRARRLAAGTGAVLQGAALCRSLVQEPPQVEHDVMRDLTGARFGLTPVTQDLRA